MLKFLYRSCIITILSCALITQSFAQSAPPPAAVPPSNSGIGIAGIHETFVNNLTNQTTTTKEGVVIDNKTGVQTTTKTANVEGNKTETNMLNSITMAIIGVIATRLVRYMPPTTDTMFAAGAGASFIIGELSSSENVNKFTKDLTYRSDGKVDNEQMAALEKMKTDLEKARDGVEKKKQFQNIAFMAFGAATLIAAYQAYTVDAELTAVLSALAADWATYKDAELAALATTPVGTAAAALAVSAQLGCTAAATFINTTLIPFMNAIIPTNSLVLRPILTTDTAAFTTTKTTCVGTSDVAWTAAVTTLYAVTTASVVVSIVDMFPFNQQFVIPFAPPTVVVKNEINPTFLEKIFNMFISKADAGQTELLFGVGGVAAALILAQTLGVMVDTFMFTPLRRTLVWGALAVLSKLAVDSSEKTIKELEEQIAKVTAIIASMTGAGQGVMGQQMAVAQKAVMPTFGVSGGGFEPIGDGSNIPCATSTATSNCPSMAKALTNAPEWKSLPADVQGLAMGLGKYMDKVQGKPGISADAMGAGAALSGSASGLNKMLGNARANVNSQLRKMGQPAVDFNKREADLLKQMNQIAADGLQKSGMSASGFLASMGKGGGGGDGAVKKPEAPSKTFAKSTSAPAVGGGIAAPKGSMFNFKDEKPGLETGAEGTGGKNDVYEMSAKSDISADAGGSIFNLISERYFKSAYPKLLEESPTPPIAPEPVKK